MNTTTTTVAQPADQPPQLVPSRSATPYRQVAAYLVLVYAAVTAVSLALSGTIADPGPAPVVALFVPAVVVGLLAVLRRRTSTVEHKFGLRRLGLAGIPAAIVLPAFAIGGPFAVAHLLGIVRFVDVSGYLANVPLNLVVLSVLVLGEEIGWRGYMLPRLSTQMSPRRASLITGFAQGLFHLPLILLTSSYDSAGNRMFIACGAVAVITGGGVMFGWLRVRTGSLWPVAVAHAAANLCIVPTEFLAGHNLDTAAYFTGEAGLFTLAATALVAVGLARHANWTPRRNG